MEEAYVVLMISRDVSVREVVDEVRTIPGVEEAEMLFGEYDVILKIKGEKIHDIENLVVDKVSRVEGVESTITMLCVPDEVVKWGG